MIFEGQGHSEGSYNQNMTFSLSAVSYELLILLQPKFGLMAHHHKLGCPVKEIDCCVVLKIKVTAKVRKFIEFLSGPYLLNC